MKSILAALCLSIIVTAPAAAQNTQSYELPAFERIDISAGIVLVADVGEPQTIIVETDKGDFKDLDIDVKDGELRISREWNRLSWHGSKSNYKVLVSVPALTALGASSGSHAKVSNINTRRFVIDLSSGAYANLTGQCDNCIIDLSSGARLAAKDMDCESAEIDVSSGGFGKIKVSHSVVADASSGGHVTIYGNPERVNIDKSSGGHIKIITAAQARND